RVQLGRHSQRPGEGGGDRRDVPRDGGRRALSSGYAASMRARQSFTAGLIVLLALAAGCRSDAPSASAAPAPLTVDDFTFDGPLGSEGSTIEQLGENHFRVTLGAAPNQPGWPNKLNVRIRRHARGNPLRLDVRFPQGTGYS